MGCWGLIWGDGTLAMKMKLENEKADATARAAQAADSLLTVADDLAAAGVEPMSMEEINAEVKASRAERRQRAVGI
ncbi:MAG: hypothetical protein RL748_3171 [Pseudomonadota bacterium]